MTLYAPMHRRTRIPGAVDSRTLTISPEIYSGLQCWYDASKISASNDDAIGTWADLSGNSRDLTQATAGNKPLYKSAGLNSKPSLYFITDDYMTANTFSFTAITLFMVINVMDQTTDNIGIVSFRPASGNDWDNADGLAYHVGQTNNQAWLYRLSGDTDLRSNIPSAPHVAIVTMNGTGTAGVEINGTKTTDTYTNTTSIDPSLMVLAPRWVGYYGLFGNNHYSEIFAYNTLLTDAQILVLRTYLNSKWGIT